MLKKIKNIINFVNRRFFYRRFSFSLRKSTLRFFCPCRKTEFKKKGVDTMVKFRLTKLSKFCLALLFRLNVYPLYLTACPPNTPFIPP